ncbi:MAG TPA: polysaccharide deacetylase [Gaiellaceae bacterium]|jgi:peptidoglycan/xylan/chitin deacetylase (PgdA/CDA1 family)|nr:polysaccharide deacetylase [Gaiellaceae bacterium]
MIACLTFDVDAESPILVHGRGHAENLGVMSHQAFGPRVGVPRILDLLAAYELPATFFVPGLTADRHPAAVEAILAAGHEIGHHSYAHVAPVDQSEDEERRDLERGLEALARHGVEPTGYRCPGWEPAFRTPGLLAEHGFRYDSSLFDDDTPYVLETDAGDLVELPVSWELDDWEQYAYLPRPDVGSGLESPAKVLDLWRSALDAYRRHDLLYVLTCHPFLSGRAARVETLRALIEHGLAVGGVEFLACRDAAARVEGPRRRHERAQVDETLYPRH